MSTRWAKASCAAAVLMALHAPAGASDQDARTQAAREPAPSQRILDGIADPSQRALAQEVLDRNPDLATAQARARAARLRAPQAKALPDPMLGVTGYVMPPETRVGPQRLMGMVSQTFPWFGKRALKEDAALREADALDAEVEARRLGLITETRRLSDEMAFLDAWKAVVGTDRATLVHYEELARTRYASGVGIEQAVIKIQAEITKADTRLLEIDTQRAALAADLNALRDRPQDAEIPRLEVPRYPPLRPDRDALRARALALRPELAAADAGIARADKLVALARKEYKPDVTLGASYAVMGLRHDAPGIASPPPDNGADDLAVFASINLPIHRKKLAAGVEEAAEARQAAREEKRAAVAAIDRSLGELVTRVTLTGEQLRLLEDVLGVQAEQSLRSAEAGYSAGTLDSLDLLDAERVLLEVRTATERTRADYAIALARLEGAVGKPLPIPEGAQP